MSGEILREMAINGDHKKLRSYVKDKVNACSVDEYGLSALMFAVWCGHVECVKLLVSNDMGVDVNGVRCSCLNLVSSRGYSALHISALDSPSWSCKETTFILLCIGVDKSLRCSENLTAYELAIRSENQEVIEVFRKFENPDEAFLQNIENCRKDLAKNYAINHRLGFDLPPLNVPFPLPKPILTDTRMGRYPDGMIIHEPHIKPLIYQGRDDHHISEALKTLDFSKEQAEINRERREKIQANGSLDKSWKPLEKIDYGIPETKKVRRRGRRS